MSVATGGSGRLSGGEKGSSMAVAGDTGCARVTRNMPRSVSRMLTKIGNLMLRAGYSEILMMSRGQVFEVIIAREEEGFEDGVGSFEERSCPGSLIV